MTLYYAAYAVTVTFVGTMALLTVVIVADRLLIAHRNRAAARVAEVYADHTDPAWDRLLEAVEAGRADVEADWSAWESEVAR